VVCGDVGGGDNEFLLPLSLIHLLLLDLSREAVRAVSQTPNYQNGAI
jgi:hypothetical protein